MGMGLKLPTFIYPLCGQIGRPCLKMYHICWYRTCVDLFRLNFELWVVGWGVVAVVVNLGLNN